MKSTFTLIAVLWQFLSGAVTAQTAQMVRDINPGQNGSIPSTFIGFATVSEGAVLGNIFYFTANDGMNGIELWRSDGTEAGTQLVKDINPGAGNSRPERMTTLGNQILFFANDGTHGLELWKTDGTEAGTQLIKDINTGTANCLRLGYTDRERDFFVFGNLFYFFADADGQYSQLWRTDGTEQGTYRVKAVCPSCTATTPTAGWLTSISNTLYFVSEDDIWKSNGTEAGTLKVTDNNNFGAPQKPQYLQAVGNKLYFSAEGSSSVDVEPWVSNGSAAGTQLLKEIADGQFSGSFPRHFIGYNNKVYFVANQELWVTTGVANTTSMFSSLKTGNYQYEDGDGFNFLVANNLLFFNATGSSGQQEYLYATNGTAGNITQLGETNDYGFDGIGLSVYKQKVCFWGEQNGQTGIWVTNGMSGSKVFYPTNSGIYIKSLWIAGDNAFFFNNTFDPNTGLELFKLPLQPDVPLVATLTQTSSILCAGGQEAALTVEVVGGVAPYKYQLDPATLQGSSPANLGAGTYKVTVTDAAVNTFEQTIVVTAPAPINTLVQTTAAASGQSNGSATVTATGGTPAYTYLWNTGVTTHELTNVSAGTYTVTVVDANGCSKIATAVVPMATRTSELEAANFQVVPTITTGKFRAIWTGNALHNTRLNLHNAQGMALKTWDGLNEDLYIDDLPAGRYFLCLTSEEGNIQAPIILIR